MPHSDAGCNPVGSFWNGSAVLQKKHSILDVDKQYV